MPWRLVQFIAIFAVFLLFIIFNLENRSDISLGFVVFRDVPMFLTAFCSFIAGMLLTLPFLVAFKLKARRGEPHVKKADGGKKGGETGRAPSPRQEAPSPSELKDYGID